jgi:serine/threonine-protein kinase haspin
MVSRSKTKSVTQRRVYGKRRANAPRAVFDQASPVRDTTSKKTPNVDPVECLEAKLARVTIDEDMAPQHDEETGSQKTEEIEEQNQLADTSSEQSSPYPEAESPGTSITPSVQSTPEQPEPKQFETMVEVRICETNTAGLSDTTLESAAPAPKSPDTTPESTSEDQEKRNASERKVPRKKNPASRRSSGVIHENKFNDYVRPILNEALAPIAAQSIQKFGSWASRSANMFDVAKLAEGSYGEVYKLHLREEACRPVVSKSKLAKLKSYGDGVFKVVPLRAKSGPGSKKFTSIEEIVSEVKMLKYLDPIPGFARFREIHVVQGRFPEPFQNAWDHYKKTKDDCMNPNPSNKRAYPDTQLWAIIEMDDAGCELEKFSWSSIFQIYDIFWGVAMALARAEEYALFEHRDLHLGNVCIRSTRQDGCMDPPTEQDITRQSCSSGFGFSSIETTIIDYSLSRAELRLSDDPNGMIEIASSDLDKKQLFDAIGQDEDEIMQRNTYR